MALFGPEFIKKTSKLSTSWKKPHLYSDATLTLHDGSIFHVSKALLAASSLFFEKLFVMQESYDYHISNVSPSSLEEILNWIYKQKLCLNTSNVTEIMKDADYLACTEVVEQCYDFLRAKVCVDNVIGIYRFCT